MRILSIVSGKGGVGKTTSANTLAAVYAAMQNPERNGKAYRVLLVDLDPSRSASKAVGLDPESLVSQATIMGLIDGKIQPAKVPEGFFVLAGSPMAEPRGEEVRKHIHALRNLPDIDIAIIDTPPGFGPLVRAAVSVADAILSPIELEPAATETLEQVRGLLDALSATDRWLGILPTNVASRLAITVHQREELNDGGFHIFRDIPRTASVPEAKLVGRTVVAYAPRSTAAKAYIAAANDILEQMYKYTNTQQCNNLLAEV